MPFFDTHAHLDDPQLAANLSDVLQNAKQANVCGIVAIGTTVKSSQSCVRLASEHEIVWAAVGIHPNHCHEASESDWEQIPDLASQPRVVALGETGLDLHWDDCPFDIQQQWFARHIRLSHDTGLPVVIHMRDCEQQMLDALHKNASDGKINGIMHSFTGCQATADRCLELGMHISFAGMVTFKKSDDLRAVASNIPSDRLLIETDSPYLSPHPHRGQRPNEPAMVVHTAACLAEVRGVSVEEIGEITTGNAKRLFGIS